MTSRVFWLNWAITALFSAGFVGGLMRAGGAGVWLGVGVAVSVSAVFWLALVPQWIRVGRDAIAFRWLGRDRVISYRDVERLEREETQQGRFHGRSWLVLRDGTRLRLAPTPGKAGIGVALAIERAIEERLAAFRSRAPIEAPADLARAGRDDAAWLARLKEIAGAEEGFRAGSLDRDRLLEIVESPIADPTERAAAARVLRPAMSDGERDRVRVAAADTCHPKVRIALEEIAEAEDEAKVDRALTRLR
jgi:hypothetical protein